MYTNPSLEYNISYHYNSIHEAVDFFEIICGVDNMTFEVIDSKKRRLDEARPLPQYTLKSLRENLLVEWTYNSNAIEGNTLTLSETKVVLEGMTVGGKSMREHLEVINHRDAIVYLDELVNAREPIADWSIRNLHRLVLKSIDDENAGIYRTVNVLISGAVHRPPEHFMVKEQMEQMLQRYNSQWQSMHVVERAAMLHAEFVKIHPFVDGNGRTARLLMNYELMMAGYPAVVIKTLIRSRYYDALDIGHTTGDYSLFITLTAGCVEQSLDLWLSLIT